ncbi:uncharacterized protein [Palaemon carinicauda]|uniref:uncharacterized protein n=1 Tax=Palaemon carinicauda TaxID=392227 RepID=UPI0035B5B253
MVAMEMKEYYWVLSLCVIFLSVSGPARAALVYNLQPDGKPDAITRLQVNLEDVAAGNHEQTVSSFSLCLWFSLSYFNRLTESLLSYAYSDHDSEVINIWVNQEVVGATYDYNSINKSDSISPLRWHSVCLVVDPERFILHVNNETVYKQAQNKPLNLRGSLVLGQDQDGFDKGYSPHQAFMGKVTGLTFWKTALMPKQVWEWHECIDGEVLPLLAWTNITFNTYGNLRTEEFELCSQRTDLNENNVFLFPGEKTWQEAYDLLKKMGLEIVVPKNEEEVHVISKLLGKYHDYCKSSVNAAKCVWIGLMCKEKGRDFFDAYTKQNISYSVWDQKSLMKMKKGVGNDCHAVQDENSTWRTEVGNTKFCYAGVMRTVGTMYSLKGDIKSERCKKISFVLAGYEERELYFHSGCGFWIRRVGKGQWKLYDSINKIYMASLFMEDDLPFGVRYWNWTAERYEGKRLMTFSACEEFTCSDGSCVPQSQRCDGVVNCQDGWDENNCHTASKPVNQSLASPPPGLFLDIFIRLNRITNVDLLGMKFDVDFFIQLEWIDQRLQYYNLALDKRTILSFGDDSIAEQLWTPKIIVTNSPTADTIYSQIPHIYRKGSGRKKGDDVEYSGYEAYLNVSLRSQTSVFCRFDLQYFPFDEQNCSLVLHIVNVEGYSVYYNSTYQVVKEEDAALTHYLLKDIRLNIRNNTNVFIMSVTLYQKAEYYIWAIYLPTLLMGFIGYCTLFLPVEFFSERGGISLTTLLVLISLYADSSDNFPKTMYLKLVEVWFVFLIVYISAIITLHLATCNAGNGHTTDTLFIKRFNLPSDDKRQFIACSGKDYKTRLLVFARYFFGGAFALFVLAYVNLT